MSDMIVKLAKEIHKRDNKTGIGPCVGTVTNANPVTVAICDGAVLLEKGDNARVCQDLVERTYKARINDSNPPDKLELKDVLKAGDEVLCIPCEGEQTWIIVDKVVG